LILPLPLTKPNIYFKEKHETPNVVVVFFTEATAWVAQGKLHHCQLLDCSITNHSKNNNRGSRGRDHIVDVFTTTYAIRNLYFNMKQIHSYSPYLLVLKR
jgi:hypothetical protein